MFMSAMLSVVVDVTKFPMYTVCNEAPTELLAALILSEPVAHPTSGSPLRVLLVPFRRHFLPRADGWNPSSSPDLPRPLADVAGCCSIDVLSVVSWDVWPTGGTTGFAITAVVLSMAFGVKESPSSVLLSHFSAEEGSDSSSDTSLDLLTQHMADGYHSTSGTWPC